jgi:Transglycosylase SLT domain
MPIEGWRKPAVKRRSKRAPRQSHSPLREYPTRTVRKRRSPLDLWPGRRLRRRGWRAFGRAPRLVQWSLGLMALAALALAINWVYQVIRKPSELFFPVSGTLYKTPLETWRDYAPIFRRDATRLIRPELLAALAQVEGSGNPVARTYWRWSWVEKPLEMYRPASSAVGMYQITDATFAEARHYCIRGHAVVEDGPWDDWGSCWFNSLYFRVIPAHAVELTSSYLDRHVRLALRATGIASATPREDEQLAAVIHLCGAGAGEAFARRGFHLIAGQRCGDQDPRAYVSRVQTMVRSFERLSAEDSP